MGSMALGAGGGMSLWDFAIEFDSVREDGLRYAAARFAAFMRKLYRLLPTKLAGFCP